MGRSNESLIKDYEKRASICERQAKSEWALGKKGLGGEHFGRAKYAFERAKENRDKAKMLKKD